MLIDRGKLINLCLWLILLFLAFYSKGSNVPNLGDKMLIGPDPYLFYRYTESLYYNRTILIHDPLRYYPLGGLIDGSPLIAFIGYAFEILCNNNFVYNFFKFLYSLMFLNLNTNSFDFIIQITPAILFVIATIIFYFLAYVLFEDKQKAFIAALLFALIPIGASRVMGGLYEKESAALPLMTAALLFYFLAKKNNSKKKKVLYYGLSAVLMGVSSIAWGGWVIVPIVIGFYELFDNFFRDGEKDLHFSILVFALIINLVLESYLGRPLTFAKLIGAVFGTRTILIIVPILHKLLILAIRKYKSCFRIIYTKLPFGEELNIKILAFGLLIILGLPVLFDKLSFIFTNPWTERFASSVEEQQLTSLEYWLENIGISTLLLVTLFWIFKFLNLSENKFEKLLSISLPIFAIIINILEFHIIYTWVAYLLLISFYFILLAKRNVRIELRDFIFVTSFIYFAIADYIVRLIYILIFTIPLIIPDLISEISKKIDFEGKREFAVFPVLYSLLVFLPKTIQSYYAPQVYAISLSSLSVYLYPVLVLIVEFIKQSPYAFATILASILLPVFIFAILINYNNRKEITVGAIVLSIIFFGISDFGYSASLYSLNYGNSWYQRAWVTLGNIINSITEPDAVFIHWWDYGYYIQALGRRATIVDGGNAYPYWNHLVGRYVLCGNYTSALEFLFAHTHGKPTYLLIDPTDLGKFYQFSRLGSDLYYDKLSMLGQARLYIISNNTLEYSGLSGYGSSVAPLDEDIETSKGIIIPRCIPDLNIIPPKCGIVGKIELVLDQKISDSTLYYVNSTLLYNLSKAVVIQGKIMFPRTALVTNAKDVINKIINSKVTGGWVYIYYSPTGDRNDLREFKIPLKCVSIGPKIIYNNEKGWGCLYLVPCSYNAENTRTCAFFITNKALNYLWIKLYFFEEKNPYFEEVFSTGPLTFESVPWKIWRVKYPENLSIDPYKECLYLARNLAEINKCAKKYGKPTFRTYWEV